MKKERVSDAALSDLETTTKRSTHDLSEIDDDTAAQYDDYAAGLEDGA